MPLQAQEPERTARVIFNPFSPAPLSQAPRRAEVIRPPAVSFEPTTAAEADIALARHEALWKLAFTGTMREAYSGIHADTRPPPPPTLSAVERLAARTDLLRMAPTAFNIAAAALRPFARSFVLYAPPTGNDCHPLAEAILEDAEAIAASLGVSKKIHVGRAHAANGSPGYRPDRWGFHTAAIVADDERCYVADPLVMVPVELDRWLSLMSEPGRRPGDPCLEHAYVSAFQEFKSPPPPVLAKWAAAAARTPEFTMQR